MRLNQDGIDLIKQFEGLELEAYTCPAGKATLGYGSTGPDIKLGMKWTKEQAEDRLKNDLGTFSKGVRNLIKVVLNENQFSAVVALAYNIGLGNFKNSTLLKKLNASDFPGAAAEFERWNKGGGRVLKGLVKRREAEKTLFLKA